MQPAVPATPCPDAMAEQGASESHRLEAAFDDAAVDACTASMVRGERAAYEALFLNRHAFLEAEARHRLGRRRELVDDVVQESWLRIARGPRRCAGGASLDAWLRRIVRSAAIDLLRSELARRCREQRVASTRAEAVSFVEDFELLEEMRHRAAGLAGVRADERALLEVQARTDATVAQLAAWLGIGRAAVDSKIRRAAERARAQRSEP
jgi:RNA polymerase sigma factor (sigma-70 family)